MIAGVRVHTIICDVNSLTWGGRSGKAWRALVDSLHISPKKRIEQWMLQQHIVQKNDEYLVNA